MNNAFVRFGLKCVSSMSAVVLAGGLIVGSAMAATPNKVTVTLPHAVTVGSTTLPSGNYIISTLDMSDGEFFVIRNADKNAAVVTIQAMKINADQADKTQLVFSQEGDTWHFDKMFIAGEDSGYQFLGAK